LLLLELWKRSAVVRFSKIELTRYFYLVNLTSFNRKFFRVQMYKDSIKINHGVYKFSFTAASLQVSVMIGLAQKMVREKLTLDELQPEDIGKERAKPIKREFKEMKDRLATLSEE